nr:DciA family protein [Sphingomonas sp. Y57]
MKRAMSETGKTRSSTKGQASSTAKAAREPRPRGGGARRVADMVPDIGRAAFRRFGFVQSSVVSRWAEIVGERYARVSIPESIRFPQGRRADGVLTLTVEGSHGTMLQHVAPTIIERVNRFFGYSAVARIAIKPGACAAPPSPRGRIAPPSLKPVPIELGDSLRTVGDPELRACLESLAGALAATIGPPVIASGDSDR